MIQKSLLDDFCCSHGHAVVETFIQPARPETRRDLPYGYTDPTYAQILRSVGIQDAKVWGHQAEAMEAISSGLNAVLSTGTASGKSLIFQMAAIRKLAQNKDARALVFYPTKALNNDQVLSWRKMTRAAGFPEEQLGSSGRHGARRGAHGPRQGFAHPPDDSRCLPRLDDGQPRPEACPGLHGRAQA